METSHKVDIFRYESHQLTNDPIQDSDFTIFHFIVDRVYKESVNLRGRLNKEI